MSMWKLTWIEPGDGYIHFRLEENNLWYETKEEAEKACKLKEKEYGVEFHVLKDQVQEDCYWAQRKIPTEFLS